MSNRQNPQTTSRPHGAVKKNPNSALALRLDDLNVRRRVTIVDLRDDHTTHHAEFIVVTRPHVITPHKFDYVVVAMRSVKTGRIENHHLTDMGVIPYSHKHWHPRYVTIATDKVHLLSTGATGLAARRYRNLLWLRENLGATALQGYDLDT